MTEFPNKGDQSLRILDLCRYVKNAQIYLFLKAPHFFIILKVWSERDWNTPRRVLPLAVEPQCLISVSYTHLTLPTILRV